MYFYVIISMSYVDKTEDLKQRIVKLKSDFINQRM